MSTDPTLYGPGEILEWVCPRFGFVRQWRVLGVYLGATGQEGIVELENVTEEPGLVPDLSPFPIQNLYVPEALLRTLRNVTRENAH